MLGVLRFVLAYLVFLSHFPENGLRLNLGVVSVVIFYFISGYLMMKSYQRFQQYSATPVRKFYIDRCIKIFPQYLVVLLLTVICFKLLGPSTENIYARASFTLVDVTLQALLLPVNFIVGSANDFFPAIAGQPIIPPAWSLAVEMQFYFLVPLLVFLSPRGIMIVILSSVSLLTFSFFTSNTYLDPANFGYLYILPMLFVFVFGMMHSSSNTAHKKIAFVIWVYFCGMFLVVLPSFSAWYKFPVQEIVFGMIIALPILKYAINFQVQYGWLKKADKWLGDLSYPVFLSHYLGMYLAQHVFGVSSFAKVYFLSASVVVFLFISFFLVLIQRSIDSKRIYFRGFKSMRSE